MIMYKSISDCFKQDTKVNQIFVIIAYLFKKITIIYIYIFKFF